MPPAARTLLRAAMLFAGAAVLAVSGAMLWWDLWMDHGWPGPPRYIHALWPGRFDGADSCDVTGLEMAGVLFAVLVPVLFALPGRRRQR